MHTTTVLKHAQPDAQASPTMLCQRAVRALSRMYDPRERLYCHSLRFLGQQLRPRGVSRRYTATVLLGLSRSPADWQRKALDGHDAEQPLARLSDDLEQMTDIGEVALTLWAARAWGHPSANSACQRLRALRPESADIPTVELAWCLSALSANYVTPGDSLLARQLAHRLIQSAGPAGLFPHWPGSSGRRWARAPVCCFADQVYPIQALTLHHILASSGESLTAASRCGMALRQLQGRDGQWWWHYDVRTGRVVEGYPVYSVHQDAMAPMALAVLQEASGAEFDESINRGLAWLEHAGEINGSLIDRSHDVIWRKVARSEPGRLARHCQATACRIHSALRVPGLGLLFRPTRIDFETRPYHMGWILYAWAESVACGDSR